MQGQADAGGRDAEQRSPTLAVLLELFAVWVPLLRGRCAVNADVADAILLEKVCNRVLPLVWTIRSGQNSGGGGY